MALHAIKRVFHRLYGRQTHVEVHEARKPPVDFEDLAARDPWFHDHFIKAPKILTEFLSRVIELEPSIVLDFGCGQGLMAKGVARFALQVHGVDIIPAFQRVEQRFQEVFGAPGLFPPVELRRVRAGKPLPYPMESFDSVYAWSVFEHVADVPYALSEIHRVIRPGGAFFLQISPLYYSAQGGHLWSILDEPWIHLRLSRKELLKRIRQVNLEGIPLENRHDALQGESAKKYRARVLYCQDTLNRITFRQLVEHVQAAGFTIVEQLAMRNGPEQVPADLLELYPEEDLRTDQVVLLMTR
jgi:SAM-dependent methyltransferase